MITARDENISIHKVATFEKVSYEVFKRDLLDILYLRYKNFSVGMFYQNNLEYTDSQNLTKISDEQFDKLVHNLYDKIQLPKRATKGSAGYDIFAPYNFSIDRGHSAIIPTGLRCKLTDGWVLQMYVRSGQGFKYGIHLENTVGIIDSDYYMNKDNEGHIKLKLHIPEYCNVNYSVKKNTAIAQGIFLSYGLTTDDVATYERVGGFGSTSK